MSSESWLEVDPITLEVIRNSLESTVEEMGITVQKLAHSPIFSESKDFSVAVFDAEAQLAALAQYTPGHQGGMQSAIEATLVEIPREEMYPGDAIMMNDSYRGGLHPQDLTIFSPVFFQDELIMYAGCVAHRVDIGGMTPGSYCPAATEIYQESIRFPCIKIMERGQMRQDILRLFLTNIRLPEDQKGDLLAQIAALRWAERNIQQLAAKYGLATFKAALKGLVDLTERRTRAEIEQIPDGVYRYTDYIDHDGINDRVYELKVAVTIKGSDVFVDFTGSSEQAEGFINSPYSLTRANSYVAFMFFLDPSIPKNQGFSRTIKVYAPPGTIFHPLPPAPLSGATTETGGRVRDLVIGALSLAMPEVGIGAWSHSAAMAYFAGKHPRTGKRFIAIPLDGLAMGGGARSHADGYGPSHPASSNMLIPNVEIIEQYYPLHYVRREIPPDAGGPGRFRGSGGLEVEWELECPVTTMVMSNRREKPPPGVFGGQPGAPAMAWKVSRGDKTIIPQKVNALPLEAGDRLMLRCPGGGGYGYPLQRDPAAVLEDLRLGFVSAEGARRDYGVVLSADGTAVDLEATARERHGRVDEAT